MTEQNVLTRSDSHFNMARFYLITVEQTLFGDWALIRRWGRIGSFGRHCADYFQTCEEAERAGAIWHQRKIRRGYR